MNWWELQDDHQEAIVKDDTPTDIKAHPEYKKMVGRFLGGLFKDKALEQSKRRTAINVARETADMVNEDKEWEGYMPNKLDQEMKDYTYGEKLHP